MARLKPGERIRQGKLRTLASKVTIQRTDRNGDGAFIACVLFSGSRERSLLDPKRRRRGEGACAFGRNPRRALAAAFSASATKLRQRKGAFAGDHR